MNESKAAVVDFLTRYGMYYRQIDKKKAMNDFLREMDAGLTRSHPSSLQMIPSFVYECQEVHRKETVVTVDIGGTHLRVATVRFSSEGVPEVEDIRTYETPGTKQKISRHAFFIEIARCLKPVVRNHKLVGCCFSFAIRPEENGDAVVVASGKQLMVPDLIGAEVGKSLRDAMAEEGMGTDIRIAVVNDAVAVLLGGIRPVPSRRFDGTVGFIYGTGTNVSYFERPENIPGINDHRRMLINVEPCGYTGFPRGAIDTVFDRHLTDFGIDQYEKMVAGKYQGQLVLETVKQADAEGLFSTDFGTKIRLVTHLASKDLDEFICRPYGTGILASCCRGQECIAGRDRTALFYMVKSIIERSALLCSVVLGAVLSKAGIGYDPCCPAYVVAEGSTFYGSPMFRSRLDQYVGTFLNEELGLYTDFFSVKDVTLVGAAVAAADMLR